MAITLRVMRGQVNTLPLVVSTLTIRHKVLYQVMILIKDHLSTGTVTLGMTEVLTILGDIMTTQWVRLGGEDVVVARKEVLPTEDVLEACPHVILVDEVLRHIPVLIVVDLVKLHADMPPSPAGPNPASSL
jgi:hypothetical protein